VTVLIQGPCLSLAAAIVVAGFATAALAEDAATEAELGSIERELQSSKVEQDRIAADIAAAHAAEEQISQQLVDTAQSIQAQEAAILAAEARIRDLDSEAGLIRADLAENQDALSNLLAGLQTLEQNPPPALVVEPQDVLAALRGAMMFGAVVPEMRKEADALVGKLTRLDHVKANIEQEKGSIRDDLARLETTREQLTGLIARKKELVQENVSQLEAEKKRSAELAGKAQSLKQLIESIAAEKKRVELEAKRQAEAREAARLKQIAALEAEKKRAEIEKLKKAQALEEERKRREVEARKPRIAFASAKGRLEYPAQGRIIGRFGDNDGLGGKLRGVAIATRVEAQVTAPADGQVEFAGEFRSFGQLLILNTGAGYHVLIAGMGGITAETGQIVRAGEPVGTMGSGTSPATLISEELQDGRPILYIEFRKNGEAVDSAPWWIGGNKQARG
jgi:septal ring factor EnvC (AmiA/AmiB activator)